MLLGELFGAENGALNHRNQGRSPTSPTLQEAQQAIATLNESTMEGWLFTSILLGEVVGTKWSILEYARCGLIWYVSVLQHSRWLWCRGGCHCHWHRGVIIHPKVIGSAVVDGRCWYHHPDFFFWMDWISMCRFVDYISLGTGRRWKRFVLLFGSEDQRHCSGAFQLVMLPGTPNNQF